MGLKIYNIRKKGLLGFTYSFETTEYTKFYKFNVVDKYADYVFVVPYLKMTYSKFIKIAGTHVFNLDSRELIVYLKQVEFVDEEPYLIDSPQQLKPYYLEVYRQINGTIEVKEVYKLIKFLGWGFEVVKVREKEPLSDQENFCISKEQIDLISLFKNQENVDYANPESVYTSFISVREYMEFYRSVLDSLTTSVVL